MFSLNVDSFATFKAAAALVPVHVILVMARFHISEVRLTIVISDAFVNPVQADIDADIDMLKRSTSLG